MLIGRVAAEHQRLAEMVAEVEQALGERPELAAAFNGRERRALQRLDYLRQALGDLARALGRFTPHGEIDPAGLTLGLALEDVAERLRFGSAPPARPMSDGTADLFE